MTQQRTVCVQFGKRGTTPVIHDFSKAQIRIGRDPGAEIHLPDPEVSRIHAVIDRVAHAWQLQDAHSANGVLVNGRSATRCRLAVDDVVQIGQWQLRITHSSKTGLLWIEARAVEANSALNTVWGPDQATLRTDGSQALN